MPIGVEDGAGKGLVTSLSVELRQPGKPKLQPIGRQVTQAKAKHFGLGEIAISLKLGKKGIELPLSERL